MTAAPRNVGTIADDVDRDNIAVIDLVEAQPFSRTYGELTDRARAAARGLVKAGIGPGQRVGLLSLNRSDYVVALLGTVLVGAIAVPLNVKLPFETLRAIIQVGEIDFIFFEPAFREFVADGAAAVEFGSEFESFLDPGPFDAAPVSADTVSMQPYTSGSTGLPKGVLLTHGGQAWAAEILVEHRRLRPHHRGILAAPFYHKNALVAVKTALRSGGSMVIMPRFDAAAYAETIERWGVNMLTGVPTMMRLLLDSPALPDLDARRKVEVVSMGSAPASDRLLADLKTAFPNAALQLNYGTTEGGPIMHGWYHPDGKERPAHSIGYPIAGCDWKLAGDKPDEGELLVRNPGVARGYHKRPDATAERFVDGWYHTGDILRRDDDGWFYFVARSDDMINSGGENVFPQEVEAVLERHPAVRAATVIGVDHAIKGQVPVAFVILEEGMSADEDELRQFALANAPAYAHPRRVTFVSQFPLTGTNKIDKAALRVSFDEMQTSDQERGAAHV
jgi:long-chain acyl-CoA synthetase